MQGLSGRRRLHALGRQLCADVYPSAAHEPSVTTLLPAGVPLQPVGGGHTHPQITCTQDGTLVVVCAAVLDSETPGKDCLICYRSKDGGTSWSEPKQIPASHFKPASVTSLGGTGDFECYSGTLTTLPDGRLLLTWTYNGINLPPAQQAKAIAPQGGGVGAGHPGGGDHGAFLCALSSDNGKSWSDATEVSDPGGPQDGFLGTSRHGVLPWPDGRWLICPRDPPDDDVPWGPKLLDPSSNTLEPLPGLSKGLPGAHPGVRYSFHQVVRTKYGGLLAMGGRAAIYDTEGGPNGGPSRYFFNGKPTETIVLHCADGRPTSGDSWEVVENFPAGLIPPPGAHPTEWDADGDRMGRHLTTLKDGRVVLTWGQAHDPFGIWFNVSEDGIVWDPSKTVRVLPELAVMGRYQGARTTQLDAETLATVCLSVEGGVFVVKTPLSLICHY